MENRISSLLTRYERGEVRRRDLIAALAALAVSEGRAAPSASSFKGVDINHVAIDVADVARSRDFYQKHLGMPVMRENETSCFLGLGSDFLTLFKGSSPGLNHYCIGIQDFEIGKVTAELGRLGLNPDRQQDRVYFKDPDGIEVQLSASGHQP